MELAVRRLLPAREASHYKWEPSEFESVFFERYAGVVRVLENLLGGCASAEEFALETFRRLHERPEIGGRAHNLRAWLHRTAIRLGLDSLRASARRTRQESLAAEAQPTARTTPLDGVLSQERATNVRAVLAEIKPRQAQLLLMRHGGYSYKEIAAVLELQPSSIGTLLGRAEAEFGRRYKQRFGTEVF